MTRHPVTRSLAAFTLAPLCFAAASCAPKPAESTPTPTVQHVREAGGEVVKHAGHLLTLQGSYPVNQAAPDPDAPGARTMIHPRADVLIGKALVGCHTDSIGIVALEDLEPMMDEGSGPGTVNGRARPRGRGPGEDGPRRVSETILSKVPADGLDACEHFVVDATATVAVASSRGDRGKAGGLTSWELPDLENPPFAPPKFRHAVTNPGGFEGLALDGDLIIAARKPSGVSAYTLDAQRRFVAKGSRDFPEIVSAGAIVVKRQGERRLVIVSDQGDRAPVTTQVTAGPGGTQHLGHVHQEPGGRILVLDATGDDATTWTPLGLAVTGGPVRGMADLPNDLLAVAASQAGVELFDLKDPAAPIRVAASPTPGPVNKVAYSEGYVVATAWDTLRLFDVGDGGALRPLDAADAIRGMTPESLATESQCELPDGFIALASVSLSGLTVVASDFDSVFVGRIAPGGRAPRLNVHDRRKSIVAPPDGGLQSFSIHVTNGGTEPLRVTPRGEPGIDAADGTVEVAPGADAFVEFRVPQPITDGLPCAVWLESNDPESPMRPIELFDPGPAYQLGGQASSFRLSGTNACDNGTCDPKATFCFDLAKEIAARRRPTFLAFFSTW